MDVIVDYYTLRLFGFTRKLPIIKVGPKMAVASFSLLGDVELVDVIAQELVERIKYLDFDYLIATETKTLPLVYQMSRFLGSKQYIVIRRRIESYMVNPIRSDGKDPLVINGSDARLIQHKKGIVVSDVISTGKTTKKIELLLAKIHAKTIASVSVLKQGDLKHQFSYPIYYLQTIPIMMY